MGFPEAIAREQQKSIAGRIQSMVDLASETVENLRAGDPHHFAMDRETYDGVLLNMTAARSDLSAALRIIDEGR